jgi:hypothetical protein
MATRIRHPRADLYETDFYAWSLEQAAHLRARRFDDLDLDRLIEEVEDLGASLQRSARSQIRTIIEHLLKRRRSTLGPAGTTLSWRSGTTSSTS